MRKILFLLSFLLLVCSCGNKTQKSTQEKDSTNISVAEKEVSDAEKEKALQGFPALVYAKVNKVLSQQFVNLEELDTAFFAQSYLDLKAEVLKAQDGKPFDELFFVEYMPFSQGLCQPIIISDVKIRSLKDNKAEVTFSMNGEGEDESDFVKMWWHLEYANGEWRIDDWDNYLEEDDCGIVKRMHEYLQKNKKQ